MVTYAGEEIERDYFARFGDQRGGKEWGTYNFTWFNGVGDWKPIDTDTTGWDEDDFEEHRQELEHELVHTMLENPNSNLYQAIENNLTEGDEEHYTTSYQVRNEDGDVQKLDFYISWDEPSEVRQKIQYYDKEPLHRLEFLAESFEGEGTLEPCPHDAGIDSEEVSWLGEGDRVVHITGRCRDCSAEGEGYVQIEFEDGERWKDDEWSAEQKKLPPVEKAIDTGIASGATMEGLDLALGAEDSWKGMKFHERYSMGDWEGWTYEDNDGIVIYIDGPNGSIYKGRGKDITLDEAKAYLNRKGIPYGRVYRSGEWDSVQFTHPKEECYKCDWSDDYYIEDARYEGDDGTGGAVFGQRCNYVLCDAERRGHVGGKVHWDMAAEDDDPYGAKWEALRKSKRYRDKAAITGKKAYDRFAKIIAEKKLEAEEPPEKDDPLESWMEDYDAEEPSVYWWTKNALMEKMKDRDLTESDLEHIITMVAANAPMDSIIQGMKKAQEFGDEGVYGLLKLAATGRGEILTDQQIHSEKLRGYQAEDTEELRDNFAQLKAKNPELAREIEFSVKNEGELPEDKIKQAGVDLDMIEAWYDLVASGDDPNLVPYESCATCEGEGIIITNYYPATRFDPADADFIDCEECIEGEYDPAYYMDKEGQYYAESFKAETNGDRQLEESVKRTKMSMIRTGLAITTFGIVLWNLWTNKKQEKQISDIMGLV